MSVAKGFNEAKYLKLQTEEILKRVKEFNNKIYIEFGGKLFDDLHASRVLPGFKPDGKIRVLKKLKDKVEVIFCINANDIEKHKVRADYGITYDIEVIRLISNLTDMGIPVNSVVITQFTGQSSASAFQKKLERNNIKTYIHTYTKGYPTDVDVIVSDEGYGANPYIKTTKPIIVVTAPGAKSGKLATCLSQLYHEYKRGIKCGYAKYETFPIWNLPLKHPVNAAYEASVADIKDVNMIDPFHLEYYKKNTVNYNRDIEIFPVLRTILEKIMGKSVYHSPTDMGVNVIGSCITSDEIVSSSARSEIIARYYKSLCDYKEGVVDEEIPQRIKLLMNELAISIDERPVIKNALQKCELSGKPAIAIALKNKKIIVGRETDILSAPASVLLNTIKYLAKLKDDIHLLSPIILEPIIKLKKEVYLEKKAKLNMQDVILALSIQASTNPIIEVALSKVKLLNGTEAHGSHFISPIDHNVMASLGINFTCEPEYYLNDIYL